MQLDDYSTETRYIFLVICDLFNFANISIFVALEQHVTLTIASLNVLSLYDANCFLRILVSEQFVTYGWMDGHGS